MTTAATFDPRSRATFKHWARIPLRYCDQDPLGHVNNGAIPMCLEQARVELISPLMKVHAGPAADIVLARVTIDYLTELTYPGTLEVGTRVLRLGTKSFTTLHGIFLQGRVECFGTAECALVYFNTATRRSLVPSAGLRAAIEALMA